MNRLSTTGLRASARMALLLTGAACALTGCTSTATGETVAQGPAMPEDPSMEPVCGDQMLGSYIGRKADDAMMTRLRDWRGDKAIRVLAPGSVATMDYRPDRLNVMVDKDNIVTGFKCG